MRRSEIQKTLTKGVADGPLPIINGKSILTIDLYVGWKCKAECMNFLLIPKIQQVKLGHEEQL